MRYNGSMVYPEKIQTNRGLVKMVVVIFIVLLILAYLGFNIRSIVASETFQDNWSFLSDLTANIWNNYLKGPLGYLWSSILVPYVWTPVIDKLKSGN